MKKFIKFTLIFLLPILTIGIIFEALLRHIPNDYSYKKEYLDSNSNQIEVLYLGNSHVYYGINPAYSKYKSFNASHISQSLNFDLAILEKYKNDWAQLKYIIIPIDYFSLYSTLEIGIENWRVKNYSIYYNINETSSYTSHFELLNGQFKTNLARLISHELKNTTDVTCDKLGWGINFNSKNSKDLIETGETASKRHTIENIDKLCYEKNVNTLNHFIEFAKKNNTKIIFITCPAYKSYAENLDQKQLNNTINLISEKTYQNSNTVYYNLLNDKTFFAEDFYDADHLNEKGAIKFTIKIDSLISGN